MMRVMLKPPCPWWGATALCLLAAFAFPASPAQTSMAASLRVNVDGITAAGGALIVGLYDEATFPVIPDTPLFKKTIPNAKNGAAVLFGRLPPGAYAVKVLQDLNNDGNREPGEPFGISNGGTPNDFETAAIALEPGNNVLTVHVH